MKRIGLALAFMVVFASQAFGAVHDDIAIGFHTTAAPIGLRWWFNENQSMAFDVAIGITSNDVGEDSETDFTLDLGLPIVMKSWDRVHLLFRPGFQYESDAEFQNSTDEVERGSNISILAELEAEVFITENFSASASHGFGIFIRDEPVPDGVDSESTTDWGTFGNNVTDIGFHLYGLWE